MQTGPSIECQGCGMPILLAFAIGAGAERMLSCPMCSHVHLWTVVDVRPAGGGGESQTSLGSSVE